MLTCQIVLKVSYFNSENELSKISYVVKILDPTTDCACFLLCLQFVVWISIQQIILQMKEGTV